MEEIIIKSNYDNYNLHLLESVKENDKGIIIIAHGMEEYKERYIYFMTKLNEAGYSTIAYDMRGHGKHLSKYELGYFCKKNPDASLISDLDTIVKYAKSKYNKDLYLFAHSMGTITARCYLRYNCNNFKKVVLCGAPSYRKGTKFAYLMAKFICMFKDHKKAKFLRNISVGKYSRSIKNSTTKVDWISYNSNNINEYIKDEYSGFGFKNNGYLGLFKLMIKSNKKIKVKNNIPNIFLIFGDGDPVVNNPNNFIKSIKKLGYNDVDAFIVENARHEILNENNKDSSIDKIIKFIDKK